MLVKYNCKFIIMDIGQQVIVGKCGSGWDIFGEFATLERTTERHLVFKTESGATIKTAINDIENVIGKADKQGYFVTPNTEIANDKNFYHHATFIY